VRTRRPSNLLGRPQPTQSLEGLRMYDEKLMVVHPALPKGGLRQPNVPEKDVLNSQLRARGGRHE
jgi:hypothetical protein